MILLVPYTNLIAMIRDALGLNAEMTIAFAHGILISQIHYYYRLSEF